MGNYIKLDRDDFKRFNDLYRKIKEVVTSPGSVKTDDYDKYIVVDTLLKKFTEESSTAEGMVSEQWLLSSQKLLDDFSIIKLGSPKLGTSSIGFLFDFSRKLPFLADLEGFLAPLINKDAEQKTDLSSSQSSQSEQDDMASMASMKDDSLRESNTGGYYRVLSLRVALEVYSQRLYQRIAYIANDLSNNITEAMLVSSAINLFQREGNEQLKPELLLTYAEYSVVEIAKRGAMISYTGEESRDDLATKILDRILASKLLTEPQREEMQALTSAEGFYSNCLVSVFKIEKELAAGEIERAEVLLDAFKNILYDNPSDQNKKIEKKFIDIVKDCVKETEKSIDAAKGQSEHLNI